MTDHRVDAEPGHFSVTTYPATISLAASFAKFWYEDALREAGGSDEHAVRREIVFSACFLESYIFEWTRDLVQSRGLGIDRVNDYFPPGNKRGLKQKWKEVPAGLYQDKVIPIKLQLDLSQLGELMRYRNGLVHAQASRPSTDNLRKEAKPIPAVGELRDKDHGWAVGISTQLVEKLHQDSGTPCPDYIR